jgi:hypothetical protein
MAPRNVWLLGEFLICLFVSYLKLLNVIYVSGLLVTIFIYKGCYTRRIIRQTTWLFIYDDAIQERRITHFPPISHQVKLDNPH